MWRSWMAAALEMASASHGMDICKQHALPKSFMVYTNRPCNPFSAMTRPMLVGNCRFWKTLSFSCKQVCNYSSISLLKRHWELYKHVSVYRNEDTHATLRIKMIPFAKTAYVHLWDYGNAVYMLIWQQAHCAEFLSSCLSQMLPDVASSACWKKIHRHTINQTTHLIRCC